MVPLHNKEAVFSRRHVPSWLLLAAAGGAANAVGFVAHARFVTHVTGAISSIGIGASEGKSAWFALESAIVLGCFVLGAMTPAALVGSPADGKEPRYALPLVVVAALLAVLGVLGTAGMFGDFGGNTNEAGNLVFLSVLSFAMGLQNSAVASSTGLIVRTTHMTGAATDLGVHLAAAVRSDGDARRSAVRDAALRAGKIAAFTAGAAGGALLAAEFEFLALLAPAAAVVAATLLSFLGGYGAPATRPLTLTEVR
jgi:uncharacterized membrane protein YoaK (UPF0700 family)